MTLFPWRRKTAIKIAALEKAVETLAKTVSGNEECRADIEEQTDKRIDKLAADYSSGATHTKERLDALEVFQAQALDVYQRLQVEHLDTPIGSLEARIEALEAFQRNVLKVQGKLLEALR